MTHSTRTPFFPANLDDYAPWVATHGLTAPYGECQCGCGTIVQLAKRTCNSVGRLRHHPVRYVNGHHQLLLAREYEQAPWVSVRGLTAPYGKCQCGCGQDAPIAQRSDFGQNLVVGQPRPFIRHHHNRCLPVKPLAERLWEKVDVRGPDECWEWQGLTNIGGYGHFRFKQKQTFVHRVSYELHYGPIPDGLFVLHKCDNPPCVNPNHLFVGTTKDNNDDKIAKGRQPLGERTGSAKLRNADIPVIRALRKQGLSLRQIGDKFGVKNCTIHAVLTGHTWGHVP